jgi:hypothetical protein
VHCVLQLKCTLHRGLRLRLPRDLFGRVVVHLLVWGRLHVRLQEWLDLPEHCVRGELLGDLRGHGKLFDEMHGPRLHAQLYGPSGHELWRGIVCVPRGLSNLNRGTWTVDEEGSRVTGLVGGRRSRVS